MFAIDVHAWIEQGLDVSGFKAAFVQDPPEGTHAFQVARGLQGADEEGDGMLHYLGVSNVDGGLERGALVQANGVERGRGALVVTNVFKDDSQKRQWLIPGNWGRNLVVAQGFITQTTCRSKGIVSQTRATRRVWQHERDVRRRSE